eukprot:Phypoly_transcript_13462.p1 GENE.Phypoly_transcript_13462~~Phypoly_transcript_13462.p1  ORF type:complete len:236 (+),score=14.33 Phypoly_transcript_13462:299-1006(+)
MYDYLIARGETPAFPNREDVPRGELVSYDEYYIPSVNLDGLRVIHRVTLTRAHTRNKGQAKGCFIDGNLAYTSGTGVMYDRITLYNPGEYSSGAEPSIMPHLWFSFGDQKITIIANGNFSKAGLLWAYGITKVPDHYAIYINNKNIQTGNTKEQQDVVNRFWHYGWTLLLFFPFYLIFILLVTFLSPVLAYTKKSEISMYLVEEKRDKEGNTEWRARRVTLKHIQDISNRSPLLS